jgi:hypothetical protein
MKYSESRGEEGGIGIALRLIIFKLAPFLHNKFIINLLPTPRQP